MQYRRTYLPGATYFFTLALQNRKSNLLTTHITELRNAFRQVHGKYPFKIEGIVILPEHLHMLMSLPSDDTNYSQRLNFIKGNFSRQLNLEPINSSQAIKRERGIWQRRFWEHTIRDELDYSRHLDYIHYNPVKHGYVKNPSDWLYSSIHQYIKHNILSKDWAAYVESNHQKFGE